MDAGRRNYGFEAIRKSQELRPGRWHVHLNLASHYFKNNEDDKAREEKLTAIRLKPDSA